MTGIVMEGFVEVTGGRIWYQRTGATSGCPLVVVHGGPGGTHDHLGPLSALGDERPIVFYDQLGSGRSERPSDPSLWRLERFTRELGELIKALRLGDRVHLLGHSWGSTLAASYALEEPSAVKGLILAGPCLSYRRWAEDELQLLAELPQEMQTAIRKRELEGAPDSLEYRSAAREHHRRNCCRLEMQPESLLKSFAGFGKEVALVMWGENHFFPTGNLKDCDLTPRLGQITAPTLLTCGRYDEARPATTAWYAGLIPRSEVLIFDRSSHMPHLEEPELYIASIRSFLRSIDGP
ncbi:MAG: proline iminopeptidase-family hydrolase [Candidatus Binataceae bacterium]